MWRGTPKDGKRKSKLSVVVVERNENFFPTKKNLHSIENKMGRGGFSNRSSDSDNKWFMLSNYRSSNSMKKEKYDGFHKFFES